MTQSSRLLSAALFAVSIVSPATAGVTFSQVGVSGSFGTGPSGTAPTIQTVTDPTSATTVNQASPGGVLSQTFTVASTLKLDAIKMVGNGGAVAVGLHLYKFLPTGTGGYDPAASGGYVPATATTGVDLLGGGSGLGFAYNGAATVQAFTFDFTDADEVTLAPGVYAFELWNNNATGGTSLNLNRVGTDAYAGGSFFGAGSTALPTSRNNVAGGLRDSAFAVYAAPVPEPSTIAALGLGALGLLRRRR